MPEPLQIRLLGEQELVRGGVTLALPPSKKTRALLGYLVLNRRALRRERLCELLWDVADDPRAALRWSLSKLRELVDGEGVRRLHADRESVSLSLDHTVVDVFELRRMLGASPSEASTETLEQVLASFRGELLEGLELSEFHAYYAFCLSERTALQRLHIEVVSELLARHEARPERALGYARRLVELEPESERARARFLRLLHASGRAQEAALESRKNQRLLDLDGEAARAAEVPALRVSAPARCVGREPELASLRGWLASRTAGVFSIEGDAGLGKSTLVGAFVDEARAAGVPVFRSEARELELASPYAAMRALFTQLSLSLDEQEPRRPAHEDETQRGLERRLGALLAALPDGALVVLEDLHWFDRMSAELAYRLAGQRGCVVLTVRAGELIDNVPARRCLAAIREHALHRGLVLAPFSLEETRQLLHAVAPAVDVPRIHRESAGNPLFALELARADGATGSFVRLARERVESLSPELADVLRWASVLGASFSVDRLQNLLSLEPEAYVDSLEQLERLGWLKLEHERARFAHEVIARAIYDGLSGPRRRLMHAKASRHTDDAGELAHHAVLAGDAPRAVRACLAAGRRCLGLLASAEAATLAQRGLSYVHGLPQPDACTLELELHELALYARPPDDPEAFARRLGELAVQALALSELASARRGFYLQAFLQWERGEVVDVRTYSLEAERCSRLSAPGERVRGLADAAHCLLALERDLTEAQAFVSEAEALIDAGQPDVAEVSLCRGALELYRGDLDAAERSLSHARERARAGSERLLEFLALELWVELDLARGQFGEEKATLLVALAETRAGSELPFALALRTLMRHANGRAEQAELTQAMHTLALADSKHRSSRLLLHWAQLALARGDQALASEKAREALALAEQVGRGSEVMIARALLVRGTPSPRARDELRELAHGSARARELRAQALAEVGPWST